MAQDVFKCGRSAGKGGAMRLFWLTALTMVAFAANSVLNRMAVGAGLVAPLDFAVIRMAAGAAMLALLLVLRRRAVWIGWSGRGAGVAGLLVYVFGFSFAYLALGAGVGALILFGAVQITMFAGAVMAREAVPAWRWIGAGLAFLGLVVLVAPGAGAVPSALHVSAMVLAGIGWGVYSLAGRQVRDPLAATAWNFILALPFCALAYAVFGSWAPLGGKAIGLAVASGAVTSGLGYALWYTLVPRLGAARAGVAQLTVPLIAAASGAALMGEAVGLRFALAAVLVLGGVAVASRQSARAIR
jgi:drug/metabolite transporter (DMT)-like permease